MWEVDQNINIMRGHLKRNFEFTFLRSKVDKTFSRSRNRSTYHKNQKTIRAYKI